MYCCAIHCGCRGHRENDSYSIGASTGGSGITRADGGLLLWLMATAVLGSTFRLGPFSCTLFCVLHLDRPNIFRALSAEPLLIQLLDELWQRRLPGFLVVIREAPKILWIHAEFPCHLDLGM